MRYLWPFEIAEERRKFMREEISVKLCCLKFSYRVLAFRNHRKLEGVVYYHEGQ